MCLHYWSTGLSSRNNRICCIKVAMMLMGRKTAVQCAWKLETCAHDAVDSEVCRNELRNNIDFCKHNFSNISPMNYQSYTQGILNRYFSVSTNAHKKFKCLLVCVRLWIGLHLVIICCHRDAAYRYSQCIRSFHRRNELVQGTFGRSVNLFSMVTASHWWAALPPLAWSMSGTHESLARGSLMWPRVIVV